MSWYQRIRELNVPGTAEAYNYLVPMVRRFYEYDRNFELAFVTRYSVGPDFQYSAKVTVYVPNENKQTLELMGVYNAGELERYKMDFNARTAANPTGSVYNADNLIQNGLFNNPNGALNGWEIDSDSGGSAELSSENDRLVLSSSVATTVVIRNKITHLTNLVTYKTILGLAAVSGGAEVNLRIGSTDGASHTSANIYNETIVASGTTFYIVITMPGAGSAKIDYVIASVA